MKRLAMVLTVLLVLSILLPAYAQGVFMQRSNINLESFIKIEEKDKCIQKTIGQYDMARLKELTEKAGVRDPNIAVSNLLDNLGLEDYKENQGIFSKLVSVYDDIEEVHLKEQYSSIDIDGNQVVLTKDECMQVINEEKADAAAAQHYKEKTDGTQSNVPRYSVVASHEWLSGPSARGRDAFSIYADSTVIPSAYAADRSALVQYTEQNVGRTSYKEKVLTAQLKSGAGLLADWYVSNYINGSGIFYSDFVVALMGDFVVTDTNPGSKLVRLWTKYVHSWLGLSLSVGWDIGASLPGVTLGLQSQTREYGFFMEFWTGSDYN